jgi:hypothetical protein
MMGPGISILFRVFQNKSGMRKFKLLFGGLVCVVLVRAQAPSFLGTKTPYVAPVASYTSPPAGFRAVFVNYVGRHGSRFMTKPGADVEALRLLETAGKAGGLTKTGWRLKGMVKRLCDLEKGQYENITLLGAEEQQAIGQRLLNRYPSVFTGKGMDVVVTYKVRTQQSADAFLRAFSGYRGQRYFSKQPDSLDAVLRFYDLSPAYQRYKKSTILKVAFDSLDRDRRTGAAAAAVCERVFVAGFRSRLTAAEELRFAGNLYDLYSVLFSLPGEVRAAGLPKDSVNVGIAFGEEELAWEDFVSGAQDFLEKGPGRDPLGIQVKVAAPLLVDFVRTTDRVVSGGATVAGHSGVGKDGDKAEPVRDAVLRFTHAEAISPFATLLGIPEASVSAAGIYNYHEHWQADKIIPLSANIQWIIYSDGRDWLVKVLLNEREVELPLKRVGGAFYRWEDLREYCLGRLRMAGIGMSVDMLYYLKELR